MPSSFPCFNLLRLLLGFLKVKPNPALDDFAGLLRRFVSGEHGITKEAALLKSRRSIRGFIRRSLAKEMIIRQSPEIIFVEDRNIAYGAHIAQVLHEVGADRLPPPDEEENTDA